MSTRTGRTHVKTGIWTLTWLTSFLLQLALSRGGLDTPAVLWIVAVLQAAIILIPAAALLHWWRGPRVPDWQRVRLMWFLLHLIALAVAMHHVHAIRTLFIGVGPNVLYPVARWTSVLALTVAIPVVILSVLVAWIAGRRREGFRVLDVATIAAGGAALSFLCLLGGALRPFDRVSPQAGDVWHRLTCVVLPVALVAVALIFWIDCIRRGSRRVRSEQREDSQS